jgi:arylsulfatase A-like enzyme
VTEGALRWLEAASPPFFAWVHYYDAHTPYAPPEDIASRYYSGDPREGSGPLLSEIPFIRAWNMRGMDRWIEGMRDPSYPLAMYAGEVHAVDREVGRLLDSLRAGPHWSQTAVIVVGDHGESLGENGIYYDHLGLHEPTLRVPLILRVPGRPAGLRIAEPALQLDIVPTVCALMGIEAERTWDGVSLVPALSGEGAHALQERGTFFFEAVHNRQVAVRRGPWKLIWNVVDRPSKRLPEQSLLYNLDLDPGESNNLFGQRPDVVAELLPFLDPWIELGAVPMRDEAPPGVLEGLRELGYVDD